MRAGERSEAGAQKLNGPTPMLRGVLYHTLRGELGWGFARGPAGAGRAVDVSRVLDMYVHARWFMLFTRELPIELCILYELRRPAASVQYMPLVTTGGQLGMSLAQTYDFDEWLTVRYASQREARLDLEAILSKQRQLKALARGLGETA
jgi:hypothetical protein